jgi:hypothetical protein
MRKVLIYGVFTFSDPSMLGVSLKEQIAQLEDAAPVGTLSHPHLASLQIELDPEDMQTRDADERDIVGIDPAAKEHYLDVG